MRTLPFAEAPAWHSIGDGWRPLLEELGRLVGCSPFYLSRLFSQGTGTTIQQYLRRIRLERAAELPRRESAM